MFKSIVVGAGGSEAATRAVDAAAELAARFGAALHLVSVVKSPVLAGAAPDTAAAVSTWSDEATAAEHDRVSRRVAELRERGIEAQTHALSGDPAAVLCQIAAQVGADLVVVGNRGMKGARRVLGSVPNSVSHSAPCSVLIVQTT